MTDEAYVHRKEYSPNSCFHAACMPLLSAMLLLVSFEVGAANNKHNAFSAFTRVVAEDSTAINSNQREPVRSRDEKTWDLLDREHTSTEPGSSYYGYGYEKRSHHSGIRETPSGRSPDDGDRSR